jgi:cobalt transporter subunit CbtA
MLARILGAACIAGFVSGLLLSLVQQWQVVPLLRAAEVFETRAEQAVPATAGLTIPDDRSADVWQPLASRVAANVVLGVGFALILAGVASLREWAGWRVGALWGLAGYIVFFVAPSIGLPPTLPGVPAAPLAERTSWWLLAVTCSAGGLWLVVFARAASLRMLGAGLLLLPHLVGAPQPDATPTLVPKEFSGAFVRATYVTNAVFWLVIGALVGAVQKARTR